MAGWTHPYELLRAEFIQSADEGRRIPLALHQAFAELDSESDSWNVDKIDPIHDALVALEPDPALAQREPDELAEIRALRPDGPRDLNWSPAEGELLDRLTGAWTGRFAGCALGKPVEGMGGHMWRDARGRLTGRKNIKRYLQNRNDWPLRDFFSTRDVGDKQTLGWPLSTRERIAFMEADDDVHYSLVGLGCLEQHGPDFRWHHVADYWLDHIPYHFICVSETQAVLNYMTRASRCGGRRATPAFTRFHRNPWREGIGARIRADGWAWSCAGNPELAAEFAYRDAGWTHARNGIYSAMMFAAIQAAAFVEHDPARLVDIGLSEIPRDCRLAGAVRQCLKWIETCRDFEACMDEVEAVWGGKYVWHVLHNDLICILSLFYGAMDTVQSPAISVMCGLDTDCNGATVGSIVGAASGRARFRMDMAGRLHDTVRPSLIGFQACGFDDLAKRSAKMWVDVAAYARQRQARPVPQGLVPVVEGTGPAGPRKTD